MKIEKLQDVGSPQKAINTNTERKGMQIKLGIGLSGTWPSCIFDLLSYRSTNKREDHWMIWVQKQNYNRSLIFSNSWLDPASRLIKINKSTTTTNSATKKIRAQLEPSASTSPFLRLTTSLLFWSTWRTLACLTRGAGFLGFVFAFRSILRSNASCSDLMKTWSLASTKNSLWLSRKAFKFP